MKRDRLNTEDLRGKVFGALTVTEFAGKRSKRPHWYCVCSCGAKRVVDATSLKTGNTQSCGHGRKKYSAVKGGKKTPEFSAWQNMISRCERESSNSFKNYGKRGIKIHHRWRWGGKGQTAFECFMDDVGYRPKKGFSLERIDNNKGYGPGNCRWATRKEQAFNRRTTRVVVVNGKGHPLNFAMELLNVKRVKCFQLLKAGVPLVDAVQQCARVEVRKWRGGLRTKEPR